MSAVCWPVLSGLPLLVVLALGSPSASDTEAPSAAHDEAHRKHTEALLPPAVRLPLGVGIGLVSGTLAVVSVGRSLWLVADAPERVLEAAAFGIGVPLVGLTLFTAVALLLVKPDPVQVLLRGAAAPFATLALTAGLFSLLNLPGGLIGLIASTIATPFITRGEAAQVVPILGMLIGGYVVAPIVAFTVATAVVPGLLVGVGSSGFGLESLEE